MKILTKIMNDRLYLFLPMLISENQSSFVKERAIADNILLTEELFHSLDMETRGSNVVIKLDMMKAYDRVKWDFLKIVLCQFGFSDHWISLAMNTLNTCHYYYILNGESCGFVKA